MASENHTNANSAYSFQSSRDLLMESRGQTRTSTLPDWDNVQSNYDYSQVMSGFSSPSESPLQPGSTTPISLISRGQELERNFPPNSHISLASLAAEALDSSQSGSSALKEDDFNRRKNNQSVVRNVVSANGNVSGSSSSNNYSDRSPQYYGGDRAFWEHHRSSFKTVAERERDVINEGNIPRSSVEPSYDVRALLNRHERMFSQQQNQYQLNIHKNENINVTPTYENIKNKDRSGRQDILPTTNHHDSSPLQRKSNIENVTLKKTVNMKNKDDDDDDDENEVSKDQEGKWKENENPFNEFECSKPRNNNAQYETSKNKYIPLDIRRHKKANQIRLELKREIDIDNENRQIATASFDRSRDLVVKAVRRASLSTGFVVKDSIEVYAAWMIKHLKNATRALDALARDSTFSMDENSWGGAFGAEVASCGRHNPCASAWLRDLGRGFLHHNPTSSSRLSVSNNQQATINSNINSRDTTTTTKIKPTTTTAVPSITSLIGDGIHFDGTGSPLTPGDGAGAGRFGAWGLSNPPPVIVTADRTSSSLSAAMLGDNHPCSISRNSFPLPSFSQEFPGKSKSVRTASSEFQEEEDKNFSSSSSSISVEVVQWCSNQMIELLDHLSQHVDSNEQVWFASETRKTLELLCESVGELTVACGSIVERLQERDQLRRTQLRDSIKHMEQVAAHTARQFAQGERAVSLANFAAMEKEAVLKAEETSKILEHKLQDHEKQLQSIEMEKNELKQLLIKERTDHQSMIESIKQEERQKRSDVEDQHESELQELRSKFEESFLTIKQSKEKELEDLTLILEKEKSEARSEAERQVNMWKQKAASAETRVREALSGRAAAETRARDVLDREIRRLRETHSEQMKQFSAQLELKDRQHESELSNERTAFLLRERELISKSEETMERCRLERDAAMKKMSQSGAAGANAVERRVRDEYEDLIRVVKATHEGELRRIGVEVMKLRREVQRNSRDKSLSHSMSTDDQGGNSSLIHQRGNGGGKNTDTLFQGLDASGQDLNLSLSQSATSKASKLGIRSDERRDDPGSQQHQVLFEEVASKHVDGNISMALSSLSLSDPFLPPRAPPPPPPPTDIGIKNKNNETKDKVETHKSGSGLPPRPMLTASPPRSKRGGEGGGGGRHVIKQTQHGERVERGRGEKRNGEEEDEVRGKEEVYGAALDAYIENNT